MPSKMNLVGPHGQLYADPKPSPDEDAFQVDNTSEAYYNSPYYLLHKSQVQPIPPRRTGALPYINLADYIPQDLANAIDAAGKITFHSVGDTGAAKSGPHQSGATSLAEQAAVADAMTTDIESGGVNGPAFFFHLGDVIYNFGEGQYYYDQFYEPYREYDRPIFAIPGNHDGMVFGQSSSAPQVPTLAAFLTNFCAASPDPSPGCADQRSQLHDRARRLLHARRAFRFHHWPVQQCHGYGWRHYLLARWTLPAGKRSTGFPNFRIGTAEAGTPSRRTGHPGCGSPPATLGRRQDRRQYRLNGGH